MSSGNSNSAHVETRTSSLSRLFGLDILRAFSIIIVVAYHVYGMMYNLPYRIDETYKMYYSLYYDINRRGLVMLAMPMFVFISGYIYSLSVCAGKYRDTKTFIINKFKRLVIPFVVFALLMMLADYSLWNVEYFKSSLYDIFVRGMWRHLWFLPMLFWSFMLTFALKPILKRPVGQFLLLIIAFIFILFPEPKFKLLGVTFLSKWYFWFYLGYLVFRYSDMLFSLIKKYHLSIVLFVLGIVLCLMSGMPPYPNSNCCGVLSISLLLLFFLYITRNVTLSVTKDMKGMTMRCISAISKYSFGIYIFHYWLAPYFISDAVQKVLSFVSLAKNHYYLFPFVFFVVAFVFSYAVTYYFQKTRLGKFLLG